MNEFSDRIIAGHLRLRVGMAIMSIALPLVLYVLGPHERNLFPLGSISEYYFTEMSDFFVGCLCAIGAFLILYNGVTPKEDWASNVAGFCLLGVAACPMKFPAFERANMEVIRTHVFAPLESGLLHGPFAVVFFAIMIYIIIYRAKDSLYLLPDDRRVAYKRWYNGLAISMAAAIASAIGLHLIRQPTEQYSVVVFWVETYGIVAFAVYWIRKTSELREAQTYLRTANQVANQPALR